jgi:RNA polymerase sigma factor (sigma-70 family)
MTAISPSVELAVTPTSTDEELIDASRRGDTRAFGQIVRRYQALVSGLIYADCGDLHRSEDLAQETFLSAWRSLDSLRDGAKLPAWLCQIARHRLIDAARAAQREAERVRKLSKHPPPKPDVAPPPQQDLLLAEESDLLWRTLAQVPQPYRETLVLYYRQGRSTADVAAATGANEATVRQRLTRGREMLREQVAAMLEGVITRSAPREVFTRSVLNALPGAMAASASGAAAAKGTAAAAKTAAAGGSLAFAAAWLGPILGVLGAGVVMRDSLRALPAEAPRRRAVLYWVMFWCVVALAPLGFLVLIHLRGTQRWTDPTFVIAIAAFSCAYGIVLTAVVAAARWWRQLAPDGGAATAQRIAAAKRRSIVAPVLQAAGGIVGGSCWLVSLALHGRDPLAAVVIALTAVAATALFARRLHRARPDAAVDVNWPYDCFLVITAVTALALNWRLHTWVAAWRDVTLEQAQRAIPLWPVNVACAVFAAWLLVLRFGGAGGRASRSSVSPEH